MVRASELTDTEHMVRTLEQAYRGMVSQKMGDTNVVVFDRSRAVPAVASQS
jgi:hypothetical protein